MTSQIWIGSISAQKESASTMTFSNGPVATLNARSKQEAVGIMIEMAHDEFPIKQGWYNHGAAAALLPDFYAKRACSICGDKQ